MPVTKGSLAGAAAAVRERVTTRVIGHQADTLEVIMVAQVSGERYVDTGEKDGNGRSIHTHAAWPKPGEHIRLPREEALNLIHNELAYPATGKAVIRQDPKVEAAIASQDAEGDE